MFELFLRSVVISCYQLLNKIFITFLAIVTDLQKSGTLLLSVLSDQSVAVLEKIMCNSHS
jgi:hypothetical protein